MKATNPPPTTIVQHMEYFPCNFFQILSVQFNIRYNAGVTFPPSTNLNQVASIWYQSIVQHGAHAKVGSVKIPGQENKAKSVIARQPLNPASPQTGSSTISFAQPTILKINGRSLQELVEDNLYKVETPPAAQGPARMFLYTDDNQAAAALVVNVNSALWDAATIKAVLETFIGQMRAIEAPGGERVTSSQPVKTEYTLLGGWPKVVQESLKEADPLFLPVGEEPAITIDAILPINGGSPCTGRDRRLNWTLDGKTVIGCRRAMAARSLMLNELGMACFTRSLAETYFKSNTDSSKVTIAQSLQIDPRVCLLPEGSPTNYLHAIGLVTYGRTVYKTELDNSIKENATVEWLMIEAERVQNDVKERISRGEGARKALELVTGKIDKENHVTCCLEFVEHGVYRTPSDSYTVELGHRFDPCPHMSVVAHVEESSGIMKIETQIGKSQSRSSTVALFERMTTLWQAVAVMAIDLK